jgi:hypothetical protein
MGTTGFRARWAAGGCGAAITLQRALDTYIHTCTHVCMEASNIRICFPSALHRSIYPLQRCLQAPRRAPQHNTLAVRARPGDATTTKPEFAAKPKEERYREDRRIVNKRTNERTNKRTNQQTNKQTNTHTRTNKRTPRQLLHKQTNNKQTHTPSKRTNKQNHKHLGGS